jgi:hypothetical protein
MGDNLIFLSKSRINKLVTEKLPYVGSVKLKRRLPAHLEIQITKTDAVFGIAQDGFYTLLDRNGKVLATNVTTYRVFLSPSAISRAQKTLDGRKTDSIAREIAKTLSELLGLDYDTVYQKANKVGRLDETLMRDADEELAAKIRAWILEKNDWFGWTRQAKKVIIGERIRCHTHNNERGEEIWDFLFSVVFTPKKIKIPEICLFRNFRHRTFW